MSSKWALHEKFDITDMSGTRQFEAHGHFGSKITLKDGSGHEVAEIRKHLLTDTHEIHMGGQRAAHIKHSGFIGDHYDIETSFGQLRAKGHFDGGDYHLSAGGQTVASMVRKFSIREKFRVDIADGQNDALLIAIILAIEAIHAERREQDKR